MRFFLRLKPFYLYNIILLLAFSAIVNAYNSFSILYLLIYSLIHFLLIYLGIYYFKQKLYLIYFFYGLGLDIFLFNEIGPHLLIFIIILTLFNFSKKYLYNLNSFSIYIIIILLHFFMILMEVLIAYLLYNIGIDFEYFTSLTILSILISLPIFIIFSKIDDYK